MQRPRIAVRPATAADSVVLAATLAAAFIDDPVMTYLFPDRDRRPAKLARFFRLIVATEPDPANGFIAGDGAAATIWRPPGAWRTPMSAMLRHAPGLLATFGLALPRALRVQGALERHHPIAPHWYLEFAGTRPEAQGKGFGGAAIRAKLTDLDAAHLPAALETATERNLAIYAAMGFRETGTFEGAPGVRFWSMWRDPAP